MATGSFFLSQLVLFLVFEFLLVEILVLVVVKIVLEVVVEVLLEVVVEIIVEVVVVEIVVFVVGGFRNARAQPPTLFVGRRGKIEFRQWPPRAFWF